MFKKIERYYTLPNSRTLTWISLWISHCLKNKIKIKEREREREREREMLHTLPLSYSMT
jgi:hypothetical protein